MLSIQIVVYDEGHRLKNYISKKSVDARRLDRKAVLLLTGTPIQNNLEELIVSRYASPCQSSSRLTESNNTLPDSSSTHRPILVRCCRRGSQELVDLERTRKSRG